MVIVKCGENDFETWCENNGERGQRLLEEWDYDKNQGIVTREIYWKTSKKVFWKCRDCEEEFYKSISSRTNLKQGCKICGHKRGGEKNRKNALQNGHALKRWCEEHGEFGEKLLEEWDEVKNREELGLEIDKITYGNSQKVYWICTRCKEPFMCTVKHRTLCSTGCNRCNRSGTSYPEQFIYHALKQIFDEAENRKKIDDVEFDIYIPSQNFCIEYGSDYYHKDKEERDNMKKEICETKGMKFMKICALSKYQGIDFSDEIIKYEVCSTKHDMQLRSIVDYIVRMLGYNIEEINFIEASDKANKVMSGKIEDSLLQNCGELALEWDIELNNGLQPAYFKASSNKKIKWKCTKCNKVWETSIKNRTTFKSSCSHCGFNIFDGKIHYSSIRKKNIIVTTAWMV